MPANRSSLLWVGLPITHPCLQTLGGAGHPTGYTSMPANRPSLLWAGLEFLPVTYPWLRTDHHYCRQDWNSCPLHIHDCKLIINADEMDFLSVIHPCLQISPQWIGLDNLAFIHSRSQTNHLCGWDCTSYPLYIHDCKKIVDETALATRCTSLPLSTETLILNTGEFYFFTWIDTCAVKWACTSNLRKEKSLPGH